MKIAHTLTALITLALISPLSAEEDHSHIEADYYESCACDVVCPCLFGGKPSQDACHGQGLWIIKEGDVDGVDLSGIKLHSAFKMGGWEIYTVSENATDEQMAAVESLIKSDLNMMGAEILGISRGKIEYDVEGDTVSYSTPSSTLEMEMVAGMDGTPIRIDNHPMFPNYRVYRSTKNEHKSDMKKFSFSGTNGFTADKIIHVGRDAP